MTLEIGNANNGIPMGAYVPASGEGGGGGSGSGDVTAAGNNNFTGANKFFGNTTIASPGELRVSKDNEYGIVASFVTSEEGIDTDRDALLLSYVSFGDSYQSNVFEEAPYVKAYNTAHSATILNTMFHAGNLLAGTGISITRSGSRYTLAADTTELQSDIADIQSDITDLQSQIGAISAALDTINGEVV